MAEISLDMGSTIEDLKPYTDRRLFTLLKKDGSPDKLLSEAQALAKKNFSFRFGKDLRIATLAAVDSVLIEFGNHDKDFVSSIIEETETNETAVKELLSVKSMHNMAESDRLTKSITKFIDTSQDNINKLFEFVKSKLSNVLSTMKLEVSAYSATPVESEEKRKASKRLWSLRLYHNPSDNNVRSGDIIINKNDKHYYLVITPGCDLTRFWSKNFGHINLVPLYELTRDLGYIKNQLKLKMDDTQANNTIKSMSVKSLTQNNIDGFPEGPFILPFVLIDNKPCNLMALPKEITSFNVPPPELTEKQTEGNRRSMSLRYDRWIDFERVTTLSDPFNAAAVQHCIKSISGYGTSDYPSIIKKALKKDFEDSLAIYSDEAAEESR